jgi:hypothetical protein
LPKPKLDADGKPLPLSIASNNDSNDYDDDDTNNNSSSKNGALDAQLPLDECVAMSIGGHALPHDLDIATARQLYWHDFDNDVLFEFELLF